MSNRDAMDDYWLKASISARKALYRQLKHAADLQNKKVAELVFEIDGQSVSSDYVRTLRDGTFAKKKAVQFFRWLREMEPKLADALCHELGFEPESSQGALWQAYLDDHGQTVGCNVVPRSKGQHDIVGLTRNQPSIQIRLGKDFYLALDAPFDGWVTALQCYANRWYPVPLRGDETVARIDIGRQVLPRYPDTDEIDYLSETNDTGPYEFAVLVTRDEQTMDILRDRPLKKSIGLQDLDNLAETLSGNQVALFRVFFVIVD